MLRQTSNLKFDVKKNCSNAKHLKMHYERASDLVTCKCLTPIRHWLHLLQHSVQQHKHLQKNIFLKIKNKNEYLIHTCKDKDIDDDDEATRAPMRAIAGNAATTVCNYIRLTNVIREIKDRSIRILIFYDRYSECVCIVLFDRCIELLIA